MSINNRIREVRRALRLTQKDFGNQIYIAQTYLSQIENGGKNVTEKIAQLVILQFHVSEDWLHHGVGEMFVERDKKQDELLHLFGKLPPAQQDTLIQIAGDFLKHSNTQL